MKTTAFDVLVVGAGPAGASAALAAAQRGLRTVILEEHQAVGSPVHCGGGLSSIALGRLGFEPPESCVSSSVKGIRVVFPGGCSRTLTEPGVVLERARFDQFLVDKAVSAGAELRLRSRVVALDRQAQEWTATTSRGDARRAKVVIDASGVMSVASSAVNTNPRPETRVGLQVELGDIPNDGYMDFYLWPEYCDDGYLWMIPKSGGRAIVGLLTSDSGGVERRIEQFLRRLGWERKPRVRSFGGRAPASGPAPHTFGDGLLLVGDAAGFTSPLFQGGIQLALMSGRFAAETAADALAKGDWSGRKLAAYERRWRKEFPNYRVLQEGRKALRSLNARQLDRMASLLPHELNSVGLMARIVVGLRLLSHMRFAAGEAVTILRAFEYSRGRYWGW